MADTVVISSPDGPPVSRPATPEEQAEIDAIRAQSTAEQAQQQRVAQFAAADDTERLRTINERARTDPAYAALADIVLRGLSR